MKSVKNLKKFMLVFTIFLTLLISIGSVCASDDNSGNETLEINPDAYISQELTIDDSPISYNEILSDSNESNGTENSTNGNESNESGTPENNFTGNTSDENDSQIIEAPKLIKLQYYPSGNNYYAKFCWNSTNGSTYEVLRKDAEDFEVISTVTADSKEMAYFDRITDNCSYAYSVREVIEKNDSERIYGPYDAEGLRLLASPDVAVDFQNLMANVTWGNIENATNYRIFRKMGRDGSFKCIAVVDANQSSYVDYYYKSANELSKILNSKTFCDPSFNNLFYTVRACCIRNDSSINYGLYLKDGDFNLEAPTIVSLNNTTIKWGRVPTADGYNVLKKVEDNWQIIGQANQKGSTTLSMPIDEIDNASYYSVQAYAIKNGEMQYSRFDEGFSLMNYSEDNSKYRILYFGDSITYGSPYKSPASRHIFSIPYRIAQLLGCAYYNPSIPGSTYHDLGQIDGVNIENTKYYRYRICREVVDQIAIGELPGNWEDLDTAENSEGVTNTRIDDYNIVVLAAGTNDYIDNTEFGPEDSNDTITFNGAFNHIMEKIENASKMRVDGGESPIKVVFIDLYYSDRTYSPKIRQNRDITPNKIGLTLNDYQNELNKQYLKWLNKSEYLIFYKVDTRSYDIVNEENCPYTSSDSLHFSKYTYGQYGNAFAKYFLENVFQDKFKTNFSFEGFTMNYGDGSLLNFTLVDYNGVPVSGVTVKVDNGVKTSRYHTDAQGTVSIPVNLAPGEYNCTISFDGNRIYNPCNITKTVIVNKANSIFNASNVVIAYNGNVSAKLTDEDCNAISGVTVKVYNGIKTLRYHTDGEGIANIPVGLMPGEYNYTFSFDGNRFYNPCNITIAVNVEKAATVIEAKNLNITYNSGTALNFTLTDCNGAPVSGVTVKVDNGMKTLRYHTGNDGIATAPINAKPGEYAYTLSFDGNKIYKASNITVNVTVNKVETVIDVDNLNVTYSNGNLTARLSDAYGKILSGVTVKVDNGIKTLRYHTDENGFLNAPINSKPGKYSYTISYDGNGIYKASNITVNVTVNKIPTILEASDINITYKNGNLTAMLTDFYGNAISGATIKFNNSLNVYRYRTDSDGIAIAPIKAKPGQYFYEISFDGNGIYAPSSITRSVVVN
ncbi:collagen binding domain-containing protein [Methanobrevibacter sp.]|uniref:MSCRAMM family protein n=1 Tax=Methanobrevibacter sp. TaxID=66852 RepID=UPI003864397D